MTSKLTNEELPKLKLTGLIIDETGTVRQGAKSVEVGWRYCRKVDNIAHSQVAVVACLNTSDFVWMAVTYPKSGYLRACVAMKQGYRKNNVFSERRLKLRMNLFCIRWN